MTELPRRPVEPLDPPPGRFDQVTATARRRRQHHALSVLGVVAVFLTGISVGSTLSLGTRVAGVPQAIVDLATNGGRAPDAPPPTSTATSASVTPKAAARSSTPSTKRSKRRVVSSAPSLTATQKSATPVRDPVRTRVSALSGRAVSVGGQPVRGLYVYAGKPGLREFVPTAQPVARTARDGSFSLACPGTPVLLTAWPLNDSSSVDPTRTATWAATFVGGATQPRIAAVAPCSRRGKVTDVVIQAGSAVSGTAAVPDTCDTGRAVSLWLYAEPALRVWVTGVRDGATYRIDGLPPGQHSLGFGGDRRGVVVAGGQTTAADVSFVCDSTPTTSPSPSPTTSPSPTATSSPSSTPSPTIPTEPAPKPATPTTAPPT